MVATPRPRTRATSRQAVLDALRAAYPHGMDTMRLIELHGPSAQSRVGDLIEDGWDISSDTSGGVAVYSLASLTRGEADPALAGCIIRVGQRRCQALAVTICDPSTVEEMVTASPWHPTGWHPTGTGWAELAGYLIPRFRFISS